MSLFDGVFMDTLEKEGPFSDDPNDPGGATCWGITEAVARANGYEDAMADMPLDRAKDIALIKYWDSLLLDNVGALSEDIARELFDTGYNMGILTPARFLQRALNALNRTNRDEPDYPDVALDGKLGPATLDALTSFLGIREEGETVMLRALNAQQAVRYLRIAEKRETSEDFMYGWLLNRVA